MGYCDDDDSDDDDDGDDEDDDEEEEEEISSSSSEDEEKMLTTESKAIGTHPKNVTKPEFSANVSQSLEDKMTALIYLQNSNGIFYLSSEKWEGSVLYEFAGKYDDVRNSCPVGAPFESWLTALAINIFEIKISNKKKLWELVVQKSKKFLKQNLGDAYEILLNEAKDWIQNR